MSLFEELKRRNVFRVGIAYLVLGWVLLQVVDVVVPILALPEWVARFVLLLLAVGFPVVLIFAWAFELTPDGIRREKDVDRSQSITSVTARKLDRTIIFILVVAVVLLLADRFFGTDLAGNRSQPIESAIPAQDGISQTPGGAEGSAASETSVAVLPFVNMSDDAGNEYFSDGISEELLNVLVRVEGLRVPSRTSSFSFKGSDKQIREIGQELEVDHVLEGSVRKAGNRIRVTAQLIDVNSDTHLWSETYTREVDDIFAVQDEIAQAIVDALKVTLSGAEKQSLSEHATDNVEAYNKYLLGRHLWNQRTPQSLLAAVTPLQEAVDLDPQYARAWAALADAYVLIPEYQAGPIDEYVPLARDAAGKALAINPDSAGALTTRAYIKAYYDYDFAGANADFARAVELEPGYATGHQWYAEVLAVQLRTDEALDQMQLAAEADPLSAIISFGKGWLLLFAGRTDEAIERMEAALILDPVLQPAISNLELAYVTKEDYARAREMATELARLTGIDPAMDLAFIDAMENPALTDRAIELIENSTALIDGATGKALYLAMLGEYELALDNLEKGFAAGDSYAIHMNRIQNYDPLRDNPRFQTLLAKMNLGS